MDPPHCEGTTWRAAAPMALAAGASFLASVGQILADNGKYPCMLQAQTGLRAFAVVALSRTAYEVVCRIPWRAIACRPLHDASRKLQIQLQTATDELGIVKSEVQALLLEKEHLEARMQRSESSREQLQSSFTSVLTRLERSERDESQLRQEILRIMTLAAAGPQQKQVDAASGIQGVQSAGTEIPADFTFAPSTPSSTCSRKRKTDQRGQSSTRFAESSLAHTGDVMSGESSFEDEPEDANETPPDSEDAATPDAATRECSSDSPAKERDEAAEDVPAPVADDKKVALSPKRGSQAKRPRLSSRSGRRQRGSHECGVHIVIRKSRDKP